MNNNIWNLQKLKEIKEFFNILRKDLEKNNLYFFHYNKTEFLKYLKFSEVDLSQRLLKFQKTWNNFNNQKNSIKKFLSQNILKFPSCFKEKERIIIGEVELDYQDILEEINILKINHKQIPYEYDIIIKKLIKSILLDKIFFEKDIQRLDINLNKNLILIEYKDKTKIKEKEYKLYKFLLKYQKLYPKEYKKFKAWLIVSCNWQDIFLQSTFKSWVSCMNLINTYNDPIIKNSNKNNIKSRKFSSIFNFKFRRSEKL